MTMKSVKYRGFYLNIKYFKCFLNNFIFVPYLFKSSKVSEQNFIKRTKS